MTEWMPDPDYAVPPGETLRECLEELHLTQTEFARRIGRPVQVVNEIIGAKKAITPETALQLEKALGISAGLWVRLEANYRLALARQRARRRGQSPV